MRVRQREGRVGARQQRAQRDRSASGVDRPRLAQQAPQWLTDAPRRPIEQRCLEREAGGGQRGRDQLGGGLEEGVDVMLAVEGVEPGRLQRTQRALAALERVWRVVGQGRGLATTSNHAALPQLDAQDRALRPASAGVHLGRAHGQVIAPELERARAVHARLPTRIDTPSSTPNTNMSNAVRAKTGFKAAPRSRATRRARCTASGNVRHGTKPAP
jgi:hypothetical protein